MINTAIFAHRGASKFFPENTMSAFEAAHLYGADGIEFDVQLSKDLVPVVIHDATLERTTNGLGKVSSYTVEQLKSLSAGEWFGPRFKNEAIPTLEEVLIWASGSGMKLNIELKGAIHQRNHVIQTIIPLIKDYQLIDKVILSSFDHRVIYQAIQHSPEIETAVIVTAALHEPEEYVKRIVGARGYHFLSPLLLEEEARELIKSGVNIRPYTVNERDQLAIYMKWGCQGVFTDDPKLAIKVREQLNC
ncbi:hypothetical protein BTR22_11745 [Alkalihalophilus pseudofirmus]|uniref:glycerophosphodiester phosphodiesterase n=1 Tax=Alkalihalophilus pseudofirmus TaxID=79885 RepID=UPI0009524555|nr:hypothetical protein BTR22_11745 [Alkalihalophilus pseudofirmus]